MEFDFVTDGLDVKDLKDSFSMLIVREGSKEFVVERKKDTNTMIIKYYDNKKNKVFFECTMTDFVKLLPIKKSSNR